MPIAYLFFRYSSHRVKRSVEIGRTVYTQPERGGIEERDIQESTSRLSTSHINCIWGLAEKTERISKTGSLLNDR